MKSEELINERFGNMGNVHNPIFAQTIKDLIDVELYKLDDLYLDTTKYTTPEELQILDIKKKTVFNFENPDGEKGSVAMDVLIHAITKNVLKGLRDGFEQLHKKDAASNISYSLLDLQKPTLSNLNLSKATDVNQAIFVLAQEIATLKTAAGLLSPSPIASPILNTNKLSL